MATKPMFFTRQTLRVPAQGKSFNGIIPPNKRISQEVLDLLGPAEVTRLVDRRVIVAADPMKGYEKPKEDKGGADRPETGKWCYPLEKTRSMSLEQLNMLVRDHVTKHGLAAVEPFADAQEACFWLAKDIEQK